jgi:hypothetical protein
MVLRLNFQAIPSRDWERSTAMSPLDKMAELQARVKALEGELQAGYVTFCRT